MRFGRVQKKGIVSSDGPKSLSRPERDAMPRVRRVLATRD